ncbi:bifunctional amine oxidase [Ceratobasidium theobromae]|uniref:Bifunctional amine oxidase n=1 Tax=Ceratobasidium theobromae TaxID=1582974 RepID=A0A5N5QFX2_9AGAM|nr:bifunctional amine oxidase [Ceratobasidium theobromae]
MCRKLNDKDDNDVKVFRRRAELILERAHVRFETIPLGPAKGQISRASLDTQIESLPALPITRVAIVGAGVAGLRAAMNLSSVLPSVEIHVYEAAAEDRIGGRLYTHNFTTDPFEYFDVGAMRFPSTPLMAKTFELFTAIGVTPDPYTFSHEQNILFFNNIRIKRGDIKWKDDPFKVGQANGGVIPDEFAKQDPSELLSSRIRLFINGLVNNYETGLQDLLEFDHFSTRSYLTTIARFSPALVDYIETMTTAPAGSIGLLQTVLEELAFKYNNKPEFQSIKWKLIAIKMKKKLDEKLPKKVSFKFQHRVTSVKYDLTAGDQLAPLKVSGINDTNQEPVEFGTYSHVLFTIPPPCLRPIDLSTCQMDRFQRGALRQVSIGPSVKIGMRFDSPWWSENGLDIKGGQSSTDRMVRTVVYPSYGEGKSKTLIASYVWTQDSTNLGAIVTQSREELEKMEKNLNELDPKLSVELLQLGMLKCKKKRLLEQVVLKDLTEIHNLPDTINLKDKLIDTYSWDWATHINSMGAFGLFGPSQFSEFYTGLTRPCAGGRVHFAGEAISTIHGWVAGALESADRAVLQILWSPVQNSQDRTDKYKLFKEKCNPDLGVDDEKLDLLAKQMALSEELQFIEFEAFPGVHHKETPVIKFPEPK